MRSLVAILYLLLNVSLLLMPFASTHAHISDDHDHATAIHGGHSHGIDVDHHAHDSDSNIVVDLQPTVTSPASFTSVFWAFLLPLACTIVLTFALVQQCLRLISPPRSDPKPPSRAGCWRPPLRGPPSFSIQSV